MPMKTNKVKSLTFIMLSLLLIIFVISCSSIYNVQVQIAQPANDEFSDDIQSLLLVNRAVDGRFMKYDEDSLQKVFYLNRFNVDTTLYDSMSADTCLQALGALLYESGRYDIIIPEERFLPHKNSFYFSDEMDWDEVTQLCTDFNTDVVLSLDYFNTHVITEYKKETLFDNIGERYFKAYYASMAIAYNALFRVYDPLKEQVIKRSFIKDTLVWEDADLSNRALFSRFTSVKQALLETGISVALDYSEQIAPKWHTQSRRYFNTGGEKMLQAHNLALKNDWQGAMKIWKEVAENPPSKSLKSKAEFNIALGYELEGDINEAIRWGLKSYSTQYRNITYNYLNTLKKRKREIESRKQVVKRYE